jgi:TetR/AcrR family transcriptional regulator
MALMDDQYFTGTFSRLATEKQERLLRIAKHAFAEGGFAATSVNAIAAAAGISIGTLYKYFRSKEDLFLAIIGQGHDLLQRVLEGIVAGADPLPAKIERLLDAAVNYSEQDPDFVKIYIDCTTQGLAQLAARLSGDIESIAAEAYRHLLKDAQNRGEIDPGLDTSVAAFCLDNLLLMLQYSFGCGYYRERLALFVGGPALADPQTVIKGTMRFIANALGCAPGAP